MHDQRLDGSAWSSWHFDWPEFVKHVSVIVQALLFHVLTPNNVMSVLERTFAACCVLQVPDMYVPDPSENYCYLLCSESLQLKVPKTTSLWPRQNSGCCSHSPLTTLQLKHFGVTVGKWYAGPQQVFVRRVQAILCMFCTNQLS